MERVYKLILGEYYYYGSTKTTLEERLRTHYSDFLRLKTKLYNKAREVGWDEVKIELVKECENARVEEDLLIGGSLEDPMCLNTRRASSLNRKEYMKQYFATLPKEKQREYSQRAYNKNIEANREKRREYAEKHKEEKSKYMKERFASMTQEQKDEINRQKRERRKNARILNQ